MSATMVCHGYRHMVEANRAKIVLVDVALPDIQELLTYKRKQGRHAPALLLMCNDEVV